MSENAADPTSNETPEVVGGVIISVEGDRIQARTDSGMIGFVTFPKDTSADGIRVGLHAGFRVMATDPSGAPTLAFVPEQHAPPFEQSFDRDVVQLHNALANQHRSNAVPSVDRIHLGEEQIQQWIECVDASLARLRKNRAKRLNEEFYVGP